MSLKGTQRIRLDIERDPVAGELVNLIQNPSGELGGWAWLTPVSGSKMSGDDGGLHYTTGGGANFFTSEDLPVTPGRYVAASWTATTVSGNHRARFEFYDGTGALLSSSPQTGAFTTGSFATAAVVVPANTVSARLRFDVYASGGGNPAAGTVYTIALATVASAATAAELVTGRTNLVANPSFESDTSSWSAAGAVLLARTTAQASDGVAAAQVTSAPNLVVNPSFETNTAGWVATTGTSQILRTTDSYLGGGALFVNPVDGGNTRSHVVIATPIPVTAGQVYYISGAFQNDEGTHAGFLVRWLNAAGAQIGADDFATFTLTTRWNFRTIARTAPAGAVSLRIYPFAQPDNADFGWVGTASWRLDAVCVSRANVGYVDNTVTNAGVTAAAFNVAPGEDYTASVYAKTAATARTLWIEFAWRNGAGATLSTSRVNVGNDSTSWQRFSRTATSPAGAASVVVTVGYTSLGSTAEVHYLDAIMVEASPTLGDFINGTVLSGALPSLPPAYYVNIIGESASLKPEREELNLGTLTATVVSTALDPSQTTLLRPGRRCRLSIDTAAAGAPGEWEQIFTGRTQKASVEYRLLEQDETKRAVISLTAVDPLAQLGQESRPDGVGTINELPYVLEGAGVPWNVNGSGNQVPTATVVATNDNAYAVDQVAVTRDSRGGYAWVDRKGVLQVWDAGQLGGGVLAALDEDDYTADFGIDYSTDRAVNIVNIETYEANPATGEFTTVSYGPYRDETSIRQWGAWEKTFTVQGLTEAQIAALAAAILAANATPTRRVNYVVVPITEANIALAALDLYDLVEISNDRAGLNDQLRIVGVSHSIDATQKGVKWLMRLAFAVDGSVAPPQVIPKP